MTTTTNPQLDAFAALTGERPQTLSQLCGAIQRYERRRREIALAFGPELPELDWCDFPTYGGAPIAEFGIWSWDADSVLCGDCARELVVVPRPAAL